MTDNAVIVTGATGGLGAAVVRVALEHGWVPCVTWRTEERLDQLIVAAGCSLSDLTDVKVDVTDPVSIEHLRSVVLEAHGKVHGLLNLVGGYRGGKTVPETTLEEWHGMMQLNLNTVFLMSQVFAPVLAGQKMGSIVNISSKAARRGQARSGAYSVSKAGVLTLTETLADELKATGVRVNAVLPSIIRTKANEAAMPKADSSRWIAPEEVAEVCMFLLSDRSSGITGQAIPAYGKLL